MLVWSHSVTQVLDPSQHGETVCTNLFCDSVVIFFSFAVYFPFIII